MMGLTSMVRFLLYFDIHHRLNKGKRSIIVDTTRSCVFCKNANSENALISSAIFFHVKLQYESHVFPVPGYSCSNNLRQVSIILVRPKIKYISGGTAIRLKNILQIEPQIQIIPLTGSKFSRTARNITSSNKSPKIVPFDGMISYRNSGFWITTSALLKV